MLLCSSSHFFLNFPFPQLKSFSINILSPFNLCLFSKVFFFFFSLYFNYIYTTTLTATILHSTSNLPFIRSFTHTSLLLCSFSLRFDYIFIPFMTKFSSLSLFTHLFSVLTSLNSALLPSLIVNPTPVYVLYLPLSLTSFLASSYSLSSLLLLSVLSLTSPSNCSNLTSNSLLIPLL